MDEHEVAVELYRTPPDEFVAARNAKVRELRAAGERDTAAAVSKLRKPSVVQWVLNTLSHGHPKLISDWANTADEVREAQRATIEGRDGPDLRSALTDLRARTVAVVDTAPKAAPTNELPGALATIAASPEATAALRAGTLGSDVAPPADVFGSTGRAAPKPARKAAPTKRAPAKKASGAKAVDSRTARRLEKLRRAVDDAEAAADDAQAALVDADADADSAADDLRAADAAVATATAAMDDARRALDAAEQRHATARRELAVAEREHRSARQRLDTSRAARDKARERVDRARSALADAEPD